MIDSQVVAFTVIAAALTLSPGPDTLLVVRNVLRGGRRDGVATAFGICTGLFLHATLSALGVSMILIHSRAAFHIVKIAGACYLVWLGMQSLRAAARTQQVSADPETSLPSGGVSRRRCFLEGLLTNVLNPKVAVFYLAFLPQFIGPTDPVFRKSLLLAGIHYTEGIIWLTALSGMLYHLRRWIWKPATRRWLDGFCGTVLVGLGARLALEKL